MMVTRYIKFDDERDLLIRFVQKHETPFTAQITKGIKRSLKQNNLVHKWYAEIAQQTGELPIDVECKCKLELGVPILRAEDDEYCEKYDKFIKRYTYNEKLEIMKYWPVTSVMKTGQCKRYMDAIHMRYSEQGVVLTIPEDDDYSAPTSSQGAIAGGGQPDTPSPAN